MTAQHTERPAAPGAPAAGAGPGAARRTRTGGRTPDPDVVDRGASGIGWMPDGVSTRSASKAYERRQRRTESLAGSRLTRTGSPIATALRRVPFVAVVILLLAAGIVGVLWLNTMSDAAALRATESRLNQQDLQLKIEALDKDVNGLQDPARLAAAAAALGMVPPGDAAMLEVGADGKGTVLGTPTPVPPGGAGAPATTAQTAAAAAPPMTTAPVTTPPATTAVRATAPVTKAAVTVPPGTASTATASTGTASTTGASATKPSTTKASTTKTAATNAPMTKAQVTGNGATKVPAGTTTAGTPTAGTTTAGATAAGTAVNRTPPARSTRAAQPTQQTSAQQSTTTTGAGR